MVVIEIESKTTEKDFSRWVKDYQKLVFTICFSFTHNYFDAEDLAQETFLSAFKHIEDFDGRNPKAYLTTIAANKCRDFLKSPKRKTQGLSDEEMNMLEDDSPTVEESVESSQGENEVLQLCSRLKEPYKSIATEYFCNNLKLSELSEKTGQNIRTLETRLYRAKKLLKALWKEKSA